MCQFLLLLLLVLFYCFNSYFLAVAAAAAADWARGVAANLPSYNAISAITAPRKL